MVYMAEKTVGGHQLFARRMDSLTVSPIPGTEDGYGPFFSPDGTWLGPFVGSEMRKIPVTGGTPIRRTEGVSTSSREPRSGPRVTRFSTRPTAAAT